mgnify:CR=1 FL=1
MTPVYSSLATVASLHVAKGGLILLHYTIMCLQDHIKIIRTSLVKLRKFRLFLQYGRYRPESHGKKYTSGRPWVSLCPDCTSGQMAAGACKTLNGPRTGVRLALPSGKAPANQVSGGFYGGV